MNFGHYCNLGLALSNKREIMGEQLNMATTTPIQKALKNERPSA